LVAVGTFTEPVSRNDREIKYRHTDRGEGFMKHAFGIGSGAVIHSPSFMQIGSGIQKLIGGDTQAHRQHGELISLLSFF
jgi:hypothetical protein